MQLVDDNLQVMQAYAEQVTDAELDPIIESSTWLGTIDEYLQRPKLADSGLSDFNLYSSGFADFNGAELVAGWYRQGFPAILCTRYEKTHIEQIRPLRRRIPVMLTPDDLNQDSIRFGLEECVNELQGNFRAHRRPWRTQIKFLEEQDAEQQRISYLVEVPAWGLTEIIRVRAVDLPLGSNATVNPGQRCHAYVNLGAETPEDMYIFDWDFS